MLENGAIGAFSRVSKRHFPVPGAVGLGSQPAILPDLTSMESGSIEPPSAPGIGGGAPFFNRRGNGPTDLCERSPPGGRRGGANLALLCLRDRPGSVDMAMAPAPSPPSLSPKGARATAVLLRDVKYLCRSSCILTTSPPGERSAEGRVRGGPPRRATKAGNFGSTVEHDQGQLFTGRGGLHWLIQPRAEYNGVFRVTFGTVNVPLGATQFRRRACEKTS